MQDEKLSIVRKLWGGNQKPVGGLFIFTSFESQ
jgi:hypothetical protein